MKDLGDFMILDSLRKEDGSSAYFYEIFSFLKRISENMTDSPPGWSLAGANPVLAYGVINGRFTCEIAKNIPEEIRVYTWPEFQFVLNLERVLE